MTEDILVKLAAILLVGVGAQLLAWRVRLPSILFLLIAGFILGPWTSFIHPDELLGDLLLPLVALSVGLILFEGGLSLRLSDLPEVGAVTQRLILLGGAITGALTALAAYVVIGLDPGVAVLLGAILTVTGPTVIIPLLEQVRPSRRVSSILRWEGIVIDPIGATLAVLVFESVLADDLGDAWNVAVTGIASTLLVGGIIGIVAGGALALMFSRYLVPDSLESPLTLAMVVGAYTLADELREESGLLAAVVMGVVLANQRLAPVKHIVHFKENIRILLLAGLFVILAARLTVDELKSAVELESIAFVAVLILVVRPVAVALASFRSVLTWQERVFLAWMAPRGIVAASVSSVFAIRLAEEGIVGAERLVPLTFAVILGTIVVYGLSAAPLARRLGLAVSKPQGIIMVGAQPWAREIAAALRDQGVDVLLADSNRANVSAARMAGLQAMNINVLGEDAMQELDFSGKGRLLAMTINDEVNTLAVQRFGGTFGRAEVYQLVPKGNGGSGKESIAREQRGRGLFDAGWTFTRLEEAFDEGATLTAPTLSDIFTFENLLAQHNRIVPLFLIGPGSEVVVFSTDKRPTPRPGQVVLSLVIPDPEGALKREVSPPGRQRNPQPEAQV